MSPEETQAMEHVFNFVLTDAKYAQDQIYRQRAEHMCFRAIDALQRIIEAIECAQQALNDLNVFRSETVAQSPSNGPPV